MDEKNKDAMENKTNVKQMKRTRGNKEKTTETMEMSTRILLRMGTIMKKVTRMLQK